MESPKNDSCYNRVKVNDIFTSFQGEGPHTGRRATFVRMSGCNLNCSWCDTKDAQDHGLIVTIENLHKAIDEYNCDYVVFTGGEPMYQYPKLKPLIDWLNAEGYTLAIETNGTIPVPVGLFDTVVVSPKDSQSAKSWIENKYDNVYIKPVVNPDNVKWWTRTLENVDPKKVYYMPQGETPDEAMSNLGYLMKYMEDHNIAGNISLRLHVMLGFK